jgi:outer membrane protein assembly factor BamB
MFQLSKKLIGVALAGTFLLAACGGGGEPQPTSFPGLTVVGNNGYLTSGGQVYKFDAVNNTEVWRYPAQAAATLNFAGQPLKMGDVVIVGGATTPSGGGYDNHLYAINDQTGAEVWRFAAGKDGAPGREFADGVVTDGKYLYAANGDHTLYVLDPSNLDGGQPKTVWTFTAQNKLWSRPLVSDGVVYQGSLDHNMYALDAATGKELWKFTEAKSPIVTQPSISGGLLYFGSFDNQFYALDAKTGAVKWKTEVDGWVYSSSLVANGAVYFGDAKGKFYALDAATGAVKWSFQTQGAIHAMPVLKDDKIYVVSGDTIAYELSATQATDYKNAKKNEGIGRRLFSTPALVGNTLLVVPLDGAVKAQALNLDTANLATRFSFPQAAK